jgi:hypothetical protein
MVICEASCSDNFHPVRWARLKEQVSCDRVPCLRSAITIGVGSFPEFPKSHGPCRLVERGDGFRKDFLLRDGVEPRPEFHVIRRAKNISYRLFACGHDEARAFDQASPEQFLRPRRASRSRSVRHRADAETGHLRKDEPHRVSLFSSAREFLDDLPVDSGLRVHEAPKVALQAGRGTAFIG